MEIFENRLCIFHLHIIWRKSIRINERLVRIHKKYSRMHSFSCWIFGSSHEPTFPTPAHGIFSTLNKTLTLNEHHMRQIFQGLLLKFRFHVSHTNEVIQLRPQLSQPTLQIILWGTNENLGHFIIDFLSSTEWQKCINNHLHGSYIS